ncbi:MAG: DNA polymerase IV [Tahibacter sp.]
MTSPRAIIHVDMDAFYAAIEQLDNPELRGKPVVVGQLGPRSVVSTCSYEARPFGVRSAMPTVTAQRLCPEAIFVPVRMQRYREVSERVFDAFGEVTPEIEGLSLDEAFLDVTRSLRLFGNDLAAIGQQLKRRIYERTGLIASVGLAHNKLLAKLASELSKPDGLLWLKPDQVQATLDPLPVARLWTVGKVAETNLQRIGIRTIGELRRADAQRLTKTLGNHAATLQRLAAGIDDRPVQGDMQEKSISAETTFDSDLDTLEQAVTWLARLSERVGERTRSQGLLGRTVTVKLRKPPFETHTRQIRLAAPSAATDSVYVAARGLLEIWWQGEPKPRLRLLGVGLSGFGNVPQEDMFGSTVAKPKDALADAINRRFGGGSLVRGVTLKSRPTR